MELKHCGLAVCPASADLSRTHGINSVTNSQVLTCGKEDNMFKGAVRYPESMRQPLSFRASCPWVMPLHKSVAWVTSNAAQGKTWEL